MMYIFCFLILISVFAIIGTLAYLLFIRKLTREHFAFATLIIVPVLLINLISLLTCGKIYRRAIQTIANEWFGMGIGEEIVDMDPVRPGESLEVESLVGTLEYPLTFNTLEQIIIYLVIGIVTILLYFLYRNWDVNISTREAKARELGSFKYNLIEDALVIIGHAPIEVAVLHQPTDSKREVFEPVITKRLPWRIRAGQLLRLTDKRYAIDLGDFDPYTRSTKTEQSNEYEEFDEGEEWHRKYKCYFSKYSDTPIAVYCCEKIPRQYDVERLIKEAGDKFEKLLIVMEDNDDYQHIAVPNPYDVEFHYQYQMLHDLVDFSDYKNWLYRQFYKEKLANSNRALNDIYVPLSAYHYTPQPDTQHLGKGEAIDNIEKYVLDWANNKSTINQHLAIVGEYGQGKSVLSLKIAKEMLANREDYQRIPIIIELRGTSPRNQNALSILGQFAAQNALNAQALYQLHRAGKLLIILEGFDEMDLVGDTEMLMAHFQQLWQLAREPQAKIIITGRPNLFTDDPQRRQALGIHTHRVHLPYTRAVHLAKMDKSQIKQALRHTAPDIRDDILQALADSPDQSSFAELVARPSTLYQLSTVWGDEIGKDTRRINAAAVIGKFIQNDYDRQSAKPVEMPLTADERSYFIMGIAVAMMLENDYTNQIKKATLRDIVQKLMNNFPEISPYRDTQQGKKQSKLPKRLKENQNALDTVFRDVIAGGILVTDLSGSDTFRFAHKSYLEYLASDFYVNFILQDEERKYDLQIANAIEKTLNFRDNQLGQGLDVDNFIAQLIANRIRLRDKKTGVEIPIEGNEKKYSKAIFDKLIPSGLGRLFPNQMFWFHLHKGLIPLHSIAMLTMIFGGTYYWFRIEYLAWATLIGLILWYIGLYYFGLLKKDEKIEIIHSQYTKRLRFWQYAMKNIQFTATNPLLLKQIKTTLSSNVNNHREIVLFSIGSQLVLFGTVVGIGVFAFVFAFEFVFVFAVAVASTVAVTGVFAFVRAFAGASVGAVAFVGAFVFAFVGEDTIAGAVAVAVTAAGAIAIAFVMHSMYQLYARYKKALKAEQTRQAKAKQPDA